MGKVKVDALFPNAHAHTNPAGADIVGKAFIKVLHCVGGSVLIGSIENTTNGVEGSCV